MASSRLSTSLMARMRSPYSVSQQKVENECKLKTKKASNVKAKEPSSHADDAELLNKLVSVALENRNHLSEQEDEEVNDNCDYEDLDAFENDNSDSEEAAQIGKFNFGFI